MIRHVVPHLVPLAAVSMLTAVVGAVVANGFASYLAFSDDMVNWGAMIFIGVDLLAAARVTAWNVLLAGSITLSLFCASFYLISLGVRDIAHPMRRATAQRTAGLLKPPGWSDQRGSVIQPAATALVDAQALRRATSSLLETERGTVASTSAANSSVVRS